jgi:predicted nucleotidyltransferase
MQTHIKNKKNYILDTSKVYSAMRVKGFKTLESLAKDLGVHRNTLLPYLTGKRALPDCLDRLLNLLDLTPGEALTKNNISKAQHALEIAELISSLSMKAPDCSFVLFGSRARGTNRTYSDYDIGVYRKNGLAFKTISKLMDLCSEWNEKKHYDVNISNLNIADNDFLKEISKDWIFLGGDFTSWIELNNKSGITLYE